MEDGIPWLQLKRDKTFTKAKEFAKEISSAMNICVLFNRLELKPEGATLHLAMDFEPDAAKLNPALSAPALSLDPGAKELIETMARLFIPSIMLNLK